MCRETFWGNVWCEWRSIPGPDKDRAASMVRAAAQSLFRNEMSKSLIDTVVDNRLYNIRRYWQDSVRGMSSTASATAEIMNQPLPVPQAGMASQPGSQANAATGTRREVMDIASIID